MPLEKSSHLRPVNESFLREQRIERETFRAALDIARLKYRLPEHATWIDVADAHDAMVDEASIRNQGIVWGLDPVTQREVIIKRLASGIGNAREHTRTLRLETPALPDLNTHDGMEDERKRAHIVERLNLPPEAHIVDVWRADRTAHYERDLQTWAIRLKLSPTSSLGEVQEVYYGLSDEELSEFPDQPPGSGLY